MAPVHKERLPEVRPTQKTSGQEIEVWAGGGGGGEIFMAAFDFLDPSIPGAIFPSDLLSLIL